jgi:hypothetical protein
VKRLSRIGFLYAHGYGYFTLSAIGIFRFFQTLCDIRLCDSFHVLMTRIVTGFGLIVGFIGF